MKIVSNKRVESCIKKIIGDEDRKSRVLIEEAIKKAIEFSSEIYDIKLYETNFTDIVGEKRIVSGCFIEKNIGYIYIEKEQSASQKRYSFTYELGNLVLYLGEGETSLTSEKSITHERKLKTEYSDREKNLNFFASEILMPKKLINYYMEMNFDYKRIATLLGISTKSLIFKLSHGESMYA